MSKKPIQLNVKVRKVGRSMRDKFNKASKACFRLMGYEFQGQFKDERFTPGHAKKARYARRSGDQMVQGSKLWKRSYQGRKFAAFKHNDPLVWSGETKALTEIIRVTSVGGGTQGQNGRVRIAYPFARKLNLRSANQRARMADEFRHVLRTELDWLGKYYDQKLDQFLATENRTK